MQRKLRIGYIHLERSDGKRPGPSVVAWNMAQELVRLGHEAILIAPSGTKCPRSNSRVTVCEFDPPPAAYQWFGGQIWLAARIARLAGELQLDIVHSLEYVSTAILSLIRPRQPVVLTVPGNIFQRLSIRDGNQSTFLNTELHKWAAHRSAAHCDYVIAFTQEMKRWWELTGSKPERTPVIPYGVDINIFKPVPGARSILEIPEEELVLLYVGRLDKEKGLFDLLNAFGSLRNHLKEQLPILYVIGAGPLFNVLRDETTHLGISDAVRLQGPMEASELPLWYSAADALVLPSWIEPFGRVILEAMACGTPVLASSTDGPKDHVRHGINGYLFEPRDREGLTSLLSTVIRNQETLATMRGAAHQYASESVSWGKIMERIIQEVYYPTIGYTWAP